MRIVPLVVSAWSLPHSESRPVVFAASAAQALWPLLCGIVVAMVFYIWHWHRVRLETLSPELVSQARKTEAMGALALLIAFFLN